jgi:hypothetical protein
VRRRTIRIILADNIRREIADRGLGTNKLADFAGVSRSQLYDVLAARKGASVDWVAKIAEMLDIEPWELLREGGAAKTGRSSARAKRGRRPKKAPARRRSRRR